MFFHFISLSQEELNDLCAAALNQHCIFFKKNWYLTCFDLISIQIKRDETKLHIARSLEADSGLTTTSEFSDSFSDTEVIENVRRRVAKKYQETQPKSSLLTPKLVLWLLVIGNLPMMFYFSVIHQRGALDVVKFLNAETTGRPDMSVLFLMPCHSTPYYR